MQHHSVFKLVTILILSLTLSAGCGDDKPAEKHSNATVEKATEPGVIARVGDEVITFGEINVMLNSAAVVGLSIPALGTPERDTARITLLDKIIDANLIYLDALGKGVDREPEYQRDLQRVTNGMLAELYLDNLLGDVSVSDKEIEDFFNNSVVPGTEFTAEARMQIESVLRKQKIEARRKQQRAQLREGVDIKIYENNFQLAGDEGRADDAAVAEVDEEKISWGEVKGMLIAVGTGATALDPLAMEMDARLKALQREIDTRLMAQKASKAGLNQDPVYQARLNEYRKTRLINIHRANLVKQMAPTDTELEQFFQANRQLITIPEFRKVQMVVLATGDEASDLKRRIEAGELTMYEAASRHSIAPAAKKDLGEIGWVQKDRVLPALQEVVFSLGPGEIGGPVQVGEEWHLMAVQDVRDAQRESLDDAATRKEARRKYIHAKLDEYTVNLRKNDFKVEVYEDRIVQLAQQEADMVGQLAEKAQEPGSVTEQRVEELQKLLNP
ncbi:MAG: peptidyl-prolyl cis-trans isomerase [Gammaproteobacteria bacterium]|jgi:parvulin-like peptidyl-prolyl isomerase